MSQPASASSIPTPATTPAAAQGVTFGSALPPAVLALADGTVFHGHSIGASGIATGEIVFNTAMSGYQEILSDPSYCRQLVTLTYPQIGNYGVSDEDMESDRIHAEALIVKALPVQVSNWRSGGRTLTDLLVASNRPGIAGVDTRKLTRLLREKGAQGACLIAGDPLAQDIGRALGEARGFAGLAGMDLAKHVSVASPYEWREGGWTLGEGYRDAARPPGARRFRVVAYDFGVKRNILRMLADRGCDITVVPAQTSAAEVLAMRPDGVFLSNGPGDPEPCDYAIAATRAFIDASIPTFGICLGHQLMALACGARTMKMKFGHHGANHPVKDLETGQVLITSQNHGFAVDPASLGDALKLTHVSLFDGSIQGLAHVSRPAFCFQGHPEASPGPHDVSYLFDRFISMMGQHAKA
ncbi:MAG: glutamine-hydrolyzing carbamoyl-phosphate synthase small subunit [Lautropia sp.]